VAVRGSDPCPKNKTKRPDPFDRARRPIRVLHADGRPGPVFPPSTEGIGYLACSPTGEWIAVVYWETGVPALLRSDGSPGPKLQGDAGKVALVAWSPQGDRFATAGDEGTLRIWHTDGRPGAVLKGDPSIVRALCWSPDGKQLATADHKGLLCVWTTTGLPEAPQMQQVKHLNGNRALAWSPDGKWLADAGWTPRATLQLVRRDGTGPEVLEPGVNRFRCVRWNPQHEQLAVGFGERVCIWDASGRLVRQWPHPGPVISLAWSPDGSRLASGTQWSCVLRLHPVDGSAETVLRGDGDTWAVAWSPDGQRLASGESTKTIRLWQSDGEAGSVLEGHTSCVDGVAWSYDGAWLASVAVMDQQARLWKPDGAPGPVIETKPGTAGSAVAWSPREDRFVAGGYAGGILYDVRARSLEILRHCNFSVMGLAWRPDGTSFVACGDNDGSLVLSTSEGMQAGLLTGHAGNVQSIDWSPDGRRIASASFHSLLIHDAVNREPQWVATAFPGYDPVAYVTFSPTGEILHGDPGLIEKELIYLVETPSGAAELLKPSEFRRRVAAAQRKAAADSPPVSSKPSRSDQN